MARNMSPYIENSKNPNPSTPLSFATAFTRILVDVPIKVQLPPKIPANEIGIKSLELEKLYFSDSCATIFKKIITTAVVLINADIDADTTINTGVIKINGSNFNFLIPLVKSWITPLSSIPIARIISAKIVIVAGFEKPLIASSGVTMPKSNKATIIKNEILSIGKNSVTKSTTVIPMIIKTKSIDISMHPILFKIKHS
ncbi:hypothetical protein ULMS_26940 [Patiriisocius marinistellae]|uniref:Uncharacterized protein n=1 Tax=Patiriisocius marinistellae TaxID=2494560 RepID=A0A5J4G312_9FLAO|nr:hypothetical protein ULMS_26940 [Patiriisocius marinistellae]